MQENNSLSAMRKAAEFRPGFRFSWSDLLVLILGAGLSILLHGMDNPLGMVIFFTVAHFFLFCNVLRMRRLYELIWAALFVVLASLSIWVNIPIWPGTIIIMLAVTVPLTVLQMRQPSYHGIFWQEINPGLSQWWLERQ
jgi:predicted membrane channel-forming protein YqfA (hemolysin III family)